MRGVRHSLLVGEYVTIPIRSENDCLRQLPKSHVLLESPELPGSLLPSSLRIYLGILSERSTPPSIYFG